MTKFITNEREIDIYLRVCFEALKKNKILCVPTDTVYGLLALPSVDLARKVAQIKGRASEKPFALFVSSLERLERENVEITALARILAKRFWPGPLTMVLPGREGCPCAVNGTVGARCPGYPFLLNLLNESGGLLINTSVNRSGEPAVHSLETVIDVLENVDLVLDIGTIPPRPASTVVDCTGDRPIVLREGAIPREELEKI